MSMRDILTERYPIPDHPYEPIQISRLEFAVMQAQAFAAGVAWQKQHQEENQ
ncbi:hypothetical protein [Bifidobacterium vansinderenii]|uniref:Uncharacterized protein n=1 Tax=Bifidobacterium vansinderenii TaxID=1984871 RepID=A0A229W0Q5_9BIFI|nr:hypothetical protein [Bifidobacterium vansinderenii]OXN01457.1 hypothetical protein Tam10B_0460 [Bifidobacterium vansinderenii]